MNFPYFLAQRITFLGKRTFSKLIVRVTVSAIVLAIAAMILSVAVLRGFKDEITEKQRGFFGDILVTKQDLNSSYENTPMSLSKARMDAIRTLPNVQSIYPFATKAGIMNVNGEVEGVLLKGVDSTYDQRYLSKTIVEGDTIDFNAENGANTQILISSYFAKRMRLKLGDDFIMYFVQEPVRKRKFVVKGIFNTGSQELDKVYVVGALSLIRRLNNLDDQEAGGYEIRVRDFEKLIPTTEQVNDHLPIDLNARNIVEQMPDIFEWLNMLDMNANIIFVLMVIVAVINMISSLLISILERTSMIGILKALGFNNRGIKRVFMYNALYIIGLGLLIGNALALGLFYFQEKTRFFKLDESTYYISYVPVKIFWYDIAGLNLALIVIAMISLFVPSMLITKISPIKAIQFK
ncbi:ABC transporter permease [Sphingobacterium spiritivorum]|uniref:ABC transporter permease n=1 Tax=Sphingobacterium spiritivorum TaxID=258 RepID=UPI003DA300BF